MGIFKSDRSLQSGTKPSPGVAPALPKAVTARLECPATVGSLAARLEVVKKCPARELTEQLKTRC